MTAEALFPRAAAKARYFEQFFRRVVAGHLIGPLNDGFGRITCPQLGQRSRVWAALLTLIALEVVLGIDNLIFISILSNKLPEHQRERARRIGIGLALIFRLALLGTIAIIVKLTAPLVTVLGQDFSWRDLILMSVAHHFCAAPAMTASRL